MSRNRNTHTNSNNASNSSNSTRNTNLFDFIEKNKFFCITVLVMLFVFLVILILMIFIWSEQMVSDYGEIIFDETTTVSDTIKVEIKEPESLSTEPYTNNDKSDHKKITSNKLPQSISDFLSTINIYKAKIENMPKIENVSNYDEKDKEKLNTASIADKTAFSLDEINRLVITPREDVFNNGYVNDELTTLLGNSYLKRSDYDIDEFSKLKSLKKSRGYFLKNFEIIHDFKVHEYTDVIISTIRVTEHESMNDYELFNTYIEILSYALIAQEKFPHNSSVNYYVGYIYNKLYNIYITCCPNDCEICEYLKENAIQYYSMVDVSSEYYETAQKPLDDLS